MDDLLIHLVMSEPRDQAEVDRLFRLDQELDDAFPNDYDGNEIGMGEFVIHLRHRDAATLLAAIRPRLPVDLVRPGSHAVIRRTEKDEVTENVVPLAGVPKVVEIGEAVRRPLSFGGIFDETRVNKALCDYLKRLWPRLSELPPRTGDAAEIAILWWIVGDISSPPIQTLRARIESRSTRTCSVRVPIAQQERTAHEVDMVVRESLNRAVEECERLIKRRRLAWDLQPARDAVASLTESSG